MAQVTVSDLSGRKVIEVRFRPSPPDTEGEVYSSSNQKIGLVKARHAAGDGTVYDANGTIVGSVIGNTTGDPICSAIDNQNSALGGVKDGHLLMQGWPPEKWMAVGTIVSADWTEADTQGVREATRASTGRDPDSQIATLIPIIQFKQRVMAGIAALLLNQLGNSQDWAPIVTQPSMTGRPPARVKPPERILTEATLADSLVVTPNRSILQWVMDIVGVIALILLSPLWITILPPLLFLTWIGGIMISILLYSLPILIIVALTIFR